MTRRVVVRMAVGTVVVAAILLGWRSVSRARYRTVVESDYSQLHALYAANPNPSHDAIGRHFSSMIGAPNGRKSLQRLDGEYDHVAYDPPRNEVYFIHERSDRAPDESTTCLGWAYRNSRRSFEGHAGFPAGITLDEVIAEPTGLLLRFRTDANAGADLAEHGLEAGARYEAHLEPLAETFAVDAALMLARRI